jgi:hypothetical protein
MLCLLLSLLTFVLMAVSSATQVPWPLSIQAGSQLASSIFLIQGASHRLLLFIGTKSSAYTKSNHSGAEGLGYKTWNLATGAVNEKNTVSKFVSYLPIEHK